MRHSTPPLGADSTLVFQMHPVSSACYTACAQAEPGQSGQAAFEMRSGVPYLRAVLSRGIGSDTCKAVDKYTELDKVRSVGPGESDKFKLGCKGAQMCLPPVPRPCAWAYAPSRRLTPDVATPSAS